MNERFTHDEKRLLLALARRALVEGVGGARLQPLDLESLPETLRQHGASFVTLTSQGELRGCVGTLEAYQSLAEDVREHALAAALNDYRFPPVRQEEVAGLEIEVSCLTPPRELEYETTDELPGLLRPGVDGVILYDDLRRATFLPQVWEKLPEPAQFLDHLCAKMGVEANLWRYKKLRILTYQVEEFHEGDYLNSK